MCQKRDRDGHQEDRVEASIGVDAVKGAAGIEGYQSAKLAAIDHHTHAWREVKASAAGMAIPTPSQPTSRR